VEMEFMHRSLEEEAKPVEPAEALSIVGDVADGLAYAHDKGVIHRDIKPHNILLTRDGVAKISDWGLGKIMSDARETSIVGFSLTYAAPEQIAPKRFGTPDARTDLYQLGVVLYELLTGTPPFTAESLGEFSEAIINEEHRPPSAFDPALAPYDEVVARCLAKHPEDRYASAKELLEEILRLRAGIASGNAEPEV
jgi:serine/threonine protein kinase